MFLLLFFKVNITYINTTFESALKQNMSSFIRYGGSILGYRYETVNVSTATSATYVFGSRSSMDTYGYLYSSSFNPNSPANNLLISDDDNGGNGQFQFSFFLQAYVSYTLVMTTYNVNVFGSYVAIVSGPIAVSLSRTNVTTTTVATTMSTTTRSKSSLLTFK